ncbi:hypothetical protein RND71_000024 [Anisodus tanguticus]|uniref:Uncharacterized protein n=1 Tax=Anisodus tanguticus TaxID=243964 RepID=A0AAE1SXY0_9SOLA|nr:hypothetical protein RND71_000024 [Anisodus tanguticus]
MLGSIYKCLVIFPVSPTAGCNNLFRRRHTSEGHQVIKMAAAQLTSKAMYNGFTKLEGKEEISKICSLSYSHRHRNSFSRISQNSLTYVYGSSNCSLSIEKSKGFLSSPVICPRKPRFLRFRKKFSSESGAEASDLQDTTAATGLESFKLKWRSSVSPRSHLVLGIVVFSDARQTKLGVGPSSSHSPSLCA